MYQIVTYTREIAGDLRVGLNEWEGVGPIEVEARFFAHLQRAKLGISKVRLIPAGGNGETGPHWSVDGVSQG